MKIIADEKRQDVQVTFDDEMSFEIRAWHHDCAWTGDMKEGDVRKFDDWSHALRSNGFIVWVTPPSLTPIRRPVKPDGRTRAARMG